MEREEEDKGAEEIFEETMAVSFPKLTKYNNSQAQESQWTPSKINLKGTIGKHGQFLKNKEKIIKLHTKKKDTLLTE